jgi:hypothetical protein
VLLPKSIFDAVQTILPAASRGSSASKISVQEDAEQLRRRAREYELLAEAFPEDKPPPIASRPPPIVSEQPMQQTQQEQPRGRKPKDK